MQISENVRALQPSATLAVAALCRQLKQAGRDILDLSTGEPDFRTPEFASQAGIAAINEGNTHYTPVPGTPELRAAIAAHLSRAYPATVSPGHIVVSNGAKQALFNACFTLFGSGDDVLVPAPYWTSYPEIITLARARPVFLSGDPGNGLKVDVAALEAARTPHTRGLMLNSPVNPTGAVYTLEELRAIAEWADRHGIWLISDEIYSRLCFTGPRAPGVLDVDPELQRRTVLIDGVSKFFAMTGWRIGFSCCDPALANQLTSLQSHVTSGASSPAQAAAVAAYRDEARVDEAVAAMLGVFRRRRDQVIAALHEMLPGADFVVPDGAFFVFLRTDHYYRDGRNGSIGFCNELIEKAGVALVPGIAFGDDRYVRLSFASPEAEVLEGIRRIGALLSGVPLDA